MARTAGAVEDEDGRNAREIRRLRRKRAGALAWFFGWIAFIPVGLIGGCGLAMLIRNDTARAVFGMLGLLAPFVSLGGLLLMGSDRGRYGRSLALAQEAEELGLAYTEQPARKQFGFVNDFQMFHDPTSEFALNFMAGKRWGTAVVILDYSCAWGHGRYAYTILQTVIVLRNAVPGVPDLVLCPKGLLGKLAEAVGLGDRPVRVPGQKEFNQAYGLSAVLAEEAATRFTSELVDLCLEKQDLVLEVHRESLLVYWTNTSLKPDDLPDRLATALQVSRLLNGQEA